MQIKLNIKPVRVVASSKVGVMAKMSLMHTETFSSFCYNALMPILVQKATDDYVRAYSLEKRRKKVVLTGKKNRKGSGFGFWERKVYSKSHWIGYYYDIPVSVLNFAKLKVVQKLRNFVIESR